MDSTFTNVGTAVLMQPISFTPGNATTGLVFDNVAFNSVGTGVAINSGSTVTVGGTKYIDSWAVGPVYSNGERTFSIGGNVPKYARQPSLVNASGAYFERPKPQRSLAALIEASCSLLRLLIPHPRIILINN